ncbi:probable biosynthetic protein, Pnap_2097 family [Novosphingobium sp. CF614]|uniref:Pnap_2097 family protein n=1 Tax=Novosphingobium sp. CF614 TaxID=1884364 RepID=UPI0008DFCA52|nr:Pnap_2097 family protein [Novosphingobium sp. CF614]SFG37489.1 probable biosynthetic protein, Pnap_2097 family [Novosphingobium sp. CF614]
MHRAAREEHVAADRLQFASLEPVRIGMPELCHAGLSENWLLKACGHRHWLALAHAHGQDTADFRDADGERLYPAFTSVRIEHGRLGAVVEHDVLHFEVELCRIGRTRYRSRIAVRSAGTSVATLVMESAFVRRTRRGENRSAARSVVARPCRLLPPLTPQRPAAAPELEGLSLLGAADKPELIFDPAPHEDFNGADFLYFAAFQAIVDRAEWQWFRQCEPLLVTIQRTIVYLGNIELGERVRAVLRGLREEGGSLFHEVELSRLSDNAVIARSYTRRGAQRKCLSVGHQSRA